MKIFNSINMEQSTHFNWDWPKVYKRQEHKNLKYKFRNSKRIMRNYSQCFQDMFVLSSLNGKKKGSYLEIGSGDPIFGSNSMLLEIFGWKGLSVEKDLSLVEKFESCRSNAIIHGDALELDYKELVENFLGSPQMLDYLSVDIEPPDQSLKVLEKLISVFELKFRIITFEHDVYVAGKNFQANGVRERQRDFLSAHGYHLIFGNVGLDREHPFEDWWIHESIELQIPILKNIHLKFNKQSAISVLDIFF